MKANRYLQILTTLPALLLLFGCVPITPVPPSTSTQPSGMQAMLVPGAIAQLAEELAIDETEITFVSAEQIDWPDASLGCPEPDMVYAQVVTPGHIIRLAVAERIYEIHAADKPDSHFVHCEG